MLSSSGHGLPGVRVSHETDLGTGFTMSRFGNGDGDGRFDFLVGCGESSTVNLTFGKSPFLFQAQQFRVRPGKVSFRIL